MKEATDLGWRAEEAAGQLQLAIGSLRAFMSPSVSEDDWWGVIVPVVAQEVGRLMTVALLESRALDVPEDWRRPWGGAPPAWLTP